MNQPIAITTRTSNWPEAVRVPQLKLVTPAVVTRALEPAERIEQIAGYMREHLREPLRVARLAAMANLSVSHFFTLFKQCTGTAPIDFFIRLRMQRACRLLETTSLTVKEVAQAVGYDDPFYFSRVFKAVNRVAPTEYRKNVGGSQVAGDASKAGMPVAFAVAGCETIPSEFNPSQEPTEPTHARYVPNPKAIPTIPCVYAH